MDYMPWRVYVRAFDPPLEVMADILLRKESLR
jgi:hypothetical protein